MRKNRKSRRNGRNNDTKSEDPHVEAVVAEGKENGPNGTTPPNNSFKPVIRPVDKSVLMVETKNVVHEPFTANDELKVSFVTLQPLYSTIVGVHCKKPC